MIYTVRLSITDDDTYNADLRFDDTNLTDAQKTTIATAISGLKTNFDTLRDITI